MHLALASTLLTVRGPAAGPHMSLDRLRDTSTAFERLQGVDVLRVTDGTPAPITSLWANDRRAAVFFFRSFG